MNYYRVDGIIFFVFITIIPKLNALSDQIIKVNDVIRVRNSIERENKKRRLPYKSISFSSPLQPPFPNGLCGGTLTSISPSELFESSDEILSQSASNIVLPPRDINVWLPHTYSSNKKSRHPVLYVHDGQNAIQDSSSWTGSSWRIAGALTRLHERNLLSIPTCSENNRMKQSVYTDPLPILVLIPSSEGDLFLPGMRRRHLEYADLSNAIAQAHTDFIAEKLKPYIDSTFRTLPHAEHTYAMGTSLGGQASMNLLLRHGDLFGGVACLSPCFQPGTLASVMSMMASNAMMGGRNNVKDSKNVLYNKKIYMDNGGDVDDKKVPLFDVMDHVTSVHWWNPGYWWLDTQLQPSVEVMKMALDLLKEKHLIDFEWERVPGARHNERAWASRIHKPLLHLFGN